MKIRPARQGDYLQLIKLLNGFVGEDRYSKLNSDSVKKVIRSKTNYIYVASIKNQLVGFVTFSVRRVARYSKPIAEMDELYVDPKYRRQGLGRKLTQAIVDKAKKLDCYRMFIESHYKHKPAHRMYEKLGFTNYGYHFIKNLNP